MVVKGGWEKRDMGGTRLGGREKGGVGMGGGTMSTLSMVADRAVFLPCASASSPLSSAATASSRKFWRRACGKFASGKFA